MPSVVVMGFTRYRNGVSWKNGGCMKQRAMKFAAIHAMAQPNAIGGTNGFDPNLAAQATTFELFHLMPPLNPDDQNSYIKPGQMAKRIAVKRASETMM